MPVETEIKLRLPGGVEPAHELLKRYGFREVSARELEADQVFDLPDQALRLSGRLLRLRHRGSNWTLTYKGPPRAGRHKSREEIETQLSDGYAFQAILEAVGYVQSFRYEKYRTNFRSETNPQDGLITLDETPIGDFLELEGPEYWIDATAGYLGFRPQDYITASYATLYREHVISNPDAPSDMTF